MKKIVINKIILHFLRSIKYFFVSNFFMGIIEFEAEIKQVWDYIDGDKHTRIVRLNVPSDIGFDFSTGQAAFLGHKEVKHLDNPERLKWGIFSIASSPLDLKENNLDFCVTANTETGIAHFVSKKLNVGDKVIVKGAFGHYGLKEGYDHYFFAATGSGIAPYISMMRTLIRNNINTKITVFFGFRKSINFLYEEELKKYANEGKIELIPTISREDESWTGKRGYIQERILEYEFDKNKKNCLYVCGAPNVLDAVKDAATKKGIKEEDIFIEKW